MASSDLTLQMLLAGQQPAMQDPAVTAALPRLQLAQAMIQQGTDSSPTNKWGALSRLASALVGNYGLDKATQGVQSAYSGQAGQIADTLEKTYPNHPALPFLRSASPYQQYMGVQAVSHALPLLSGTVEGLRPGATPAVGGVPQGGPQGGYTPAAATTADVKAGRIDPVVNGQVIGGTAAAAAPGDAAHERAVTMAGVPAKNAVISHQGDVDVSTANRTVPAKNAVEGYKGQVENALRNNAPIPLSPGQSVDVNPSRAPLPPVPNVGQLGAGSPAGPGVAVPGAGMPGGAAAAFPVPAAPMPAGTAPPPPGQQSPPAAGASMPPALTPDMPPKPEAAAPAPSQSMTASLMPKLRADALGKLIDTDSAAVQKEMEKAAAGRGVYGTTATIRANLPDVTTGTGADYRLGLSQILAGMGADPQKIQDFVGTNPVNGELLQKKLFELSTGAVRGMGAREPGSVISMFQKNYPNLNSRSMTIDAMTRLLDADQFRADDYATGKYQAHLAAVNGINDQNGYKGLGDFETEFNKNNSPKIYQAAALAAGKMPYSVWSKGLSPDEQREAVMLGAQHWGNDFPGFMAPDETGKEVMHTRAAH